MAVLEIVSSRSQPMMSQAQGQGDIQTTGTI